MRFLIDSQLPTVLTGWLRDAGHEADHIRGFALQRSDDETIWRLALERRAILITRDRDFAEWSITRSPAPPIVWVRLGNCTNQSLIALLEPPWPDVLAKLAEGHGLVEVHRT